MNLATLFLLLDICCGMVWKLFYSAAVWYPREGFLFSVLKSTVYNKWIIDVN